MRNVKETLSMWFEQMVRPKVEAPTKRIAQCVKRLDQLVCLTDESERDSKLPRVRIEKWAVVRFGGRERLTGIVYGHPEVKDGERIVSSEIRALGKHAVATHNTMYVLGQPEKLS